MLNNWFYYDVVYAYVLKGCIKYFNNTIFEQPKSLDTQFVFCLCL